jgi:hypothetical protein
MALSADQHLKRALIRILNGDDDVRARLAAARELHAVIRTCREASAAPAKRSRPHVDADALLGTIGGGRQEPAGAREKRQPAGGGKPGDARDVLGIHKGGDGNKDGGR